MISDAVQRPSNSDLTTKITKKCHYWNKSGTSAQIIKLNGENKKKIVVLDNCGYNENQWIFIPNPNENKRCIVHTIDNRFVIFCAPVCLKELLKGVVYFPATSSSSCSGIMFWSGSSKERSSKCSWQKHGCYAQADWLYNLRKKPENKWRKDTLILREANRKQNFIPITKVSLLVQYYINV